MPATAVAEEPAPPRVSRILDKSGSHAFLAAAHQMKPFDLTARDYVEEEYFVSGRGRIFDWPAKEGTAPTVLGEGPYTTRILVRRPKGPKRFKGTVIVEPLNPSTPVDLPIMWAQSHEYFIAEGYAWVGISIKPNTIKALKAFHPTRYGGLGMPNPATSQRCAPEDINPSSQPTTPADETGLAWDIIRGRFHYTSAAADHTGSRRADHGTLRAG